VTATWRDRFVAVRVPIRFSQAYGTPLRAWIVSRLLVFALAIAAEALWGVPRDGIDPAVPRPLALLGSWDTTWYLDIARHGYATSGVLAGEVYTNFSFFPALPLVMRAGFALAHNGFIVALVVSNVAVLIALLGFHRLTLKRWERPFADRATWVFALTPPMFYASMAYTDGILVALAIWAALAGLHKRWWLAGIAAGSAALCRPPGICVGLLVVALALSESDTAHLVRIRNALVTCIPTACALGAFFGWMQVARGSWQLPMVAQAAWRRGPVLIGWVTYLPHELSGFVTSVLSTSGDSSALGRISRFSATGFFGPPAPNSHDMTTIWSLATTGARDLAASAILIALLIRLWRTEGSWRHPWVIFSAAAVLIPLSTGSVTSMARFGVLAFPLIWALTEWISTRSATGRHVVMGVTIIVMALLVGQVEITGP